MTNFEKRINGDRPDTQTPNESSMDEMYRRVFGWGKTDFNNPVQPGQEELDGEAPDSAS